MKHYFKHNEKEYGIGTIIEIKKNKTYIYKFGTHLVFEGINDDGTYCFRALYDKLLRFDLSQDDLNSHINNITKGTAITDLSENNMIMNPNFIDGIVEAWTWYILIMCGAFFLNGFTNVIGLQVLASIIFWSWRAKKMKGER